MRSFPDREIGILPIAACRKVWSAIAQLYSQNRGLFFVICVTKEVSPFTFEGHLIGCSPSCLSNAFPVFSVDLVGSEVAPLQLNLCRKSSKLKLVIACTYEWSLCAAYADIMRKLSHLAGGLLLN